jgi:uncharacterized protein (DUF924 family)
MVNPDGILLFWFGSPETADSTYAVRRKIWFSKDPDFDQQLRDRFGSTYEQAAADRLDHWQTAPASCLALILVLDQFPRNLFRRQATAFATDAKALTIAKQAIAQGFDQALAPIQRIFMYLPLEHSECLADQLQSVRLFGELVQDQAELADTLDYAIRHRDVIERFGRFPHRNSFLGRPTTEAEAEFLKQPGSSF